MINIKQISINVIQKKIIVQDYIVICLHSAHLITDSSSVSGKNQTYLHLIQTQMENEVYRYSAYRNHTVVSK